MEHVAHVGEIRNLYKIVVVKPKGRPRHSWENNIKVDFQEIGCGDANWVHLARIESRQL
jgi:hypothetical protein